jgi:hypothetical protein
MHTAPKLTRLKNLYRRRSAHEPIAKGDPGDATDRNTSADPGDGDLERCFTSFVLA